MATEEQKRLDTRQTIRFESKHPLQSVFYESFSDVPHNVHYADGQPIWVKVAGTYPKQVRKPAPLLSLIT